MSDFLMPIAGGLLYLLLAPILGGLLSGCDRIISARMQRRKGPPLLQPFYDFLKLWGKQPIAVNKAEGFYIFGFLLFVLLTGTIFFAQGDILLVVFTLTMASVCLIIAAYAVDSPTARSARSVSSCRPWRMNRCSSWWHSAFTSPAAASPSETS